MVHPDEALKRLIEGNARYVAGETLHPHGDPSRRAELVGGQAPFATILGCADSRVAPELLFDQGLGDLFVVRVAGNVCTPDISGSIEYAVAHLDVPLVMVLGHQSCGAVTAAMSGQKFEGDIQTLVAELVKPVEDSAGKPGDALANAVKQNALHVARNLEADEPVLARAHREGKMKVVAAYYELTTGKVIVLER